MAVIVWTNNPENLKTLFLNAVRDKQLETWKFINGTTNQITHTTGQWNDLAWFVPVNSTQNNALVFKIFFPANVNLDQVRDIYGIYHGRLIEILIRRFYAHFTEAVGTARPKDYETLTEPVRNRLNA